MKKRKNPNTKRNNQVEGETPRTSMMDDSIINDSFIDQASYQLIDAKK
jgi:hypothetical protein